MKKIVDELTNLTSEQIEFLSNLELYDGTKVELYECQRNQDEYKLKHKEK